MSRSVLPSDVHSFVTVGDPRISPSGAQIVFTLSRSDPATDRVLNELWVTDADRGRPRRLTSGDGDTAPRWSPDGHWLAFLRTDDQGRPQIWTTPTGKGQARCLTATPAGVLEHTWSPSSDAIAYTCAAAPDAAAPHGGAAPTRVRTTPYKLDGRGWFAGARLQLWTVALRRGEQRQLVAGDFDVQGPVWSPDGSRIAFTADLDSRQPGTRSVCAVPAGGGPVDRLCSWTGTTEALTWTPDARSLVLAGQQVRRGDLHTKLYLLAAAGGEPQAIAPELDRNVMIGGPGYPGARPLVSVDGQAVHFCIRDRGCVHVWTAPLSGAPAEPLICGEDRVVSNLTASADGRLIAYLAADPTTPGDVFVSSVDGATERRLTASNVELLTGLTWHHATSREFATPVGNVHGWVIGPPDDRMRPLLVDLHGGPHGAWSPALDSGRLYQQVLACNGWRVLLLNTPGSDGYGQRHFSALHGAWGKADLPAVLASIDELVAEELADPTALAVTGYSYGGYLTNWLVTQTSRFAAAVTGGSLANLVSAYGSMDVGAAFLADEVGKELHEAPDRYVELSPLTYADAVTTPTLLLHGRSDDRCPVEQAEEWFAALLRRGKVETELVAYPGADHLFILGGRPSHRADYQSRVVDWCLRHVADRATGGIR